MPLTALAALVAFTTAAPQDEAKPKRPPNVVLILTDDQGYGDVGCYGSKDIETPHLDRLASEGVRFTDYHVAQAVCSASRAALLTGCYSERVSILGALGPSTRHGLHPDEETLAELLRQRGYATGHFGKWHLGHHEPFLPLQQGFDESFGLPYSNDMWPVNHDGEPAPGNGYPRLQMMEGNELADEVATLEDQARLTERLTVRALDFIDRHAKEPFFLYLAHPMPHVPLGRPLKLEGQSAQGAYGDVISEIDESTGRLMAKLDELGLADDTLFLFTSDNGPWLVYGDHAGSTGGLREGKMTIFEGGTRVPFIARFPGRAHAGGVCDGLVAAMDVVPTVAELTGAPLPRRRIDGVSVASLLADPDAASPRTELLHYYGGRLNGVRRGRWKLVLPHRHVSVEGLERGIGGHRVRDGKGEAALALYNLANDPAESVDIAGAHPKVVASLQALAESARADLGDRHQSMKGAGVRAHGRLPGRRSAPGNHVARGRQLTLDREPDPRYAGDGAALLVDGQLGAEEFAEGGWLGYQGGSVEALIDLGRKRTVQRVTASFLQCQRSWIFLPAEVTLEVSLDGEAFEPLGTFAKAPGADASVEAREVGLGFGPRQVRFVRLRTTSIGACPEWHPGAGHDAWLFMDEIVVD